MRSPRGSILIRTDLGKFEMKNWQVISVFSIMTDSRNSYEKNSHRDQTP